MSLELRLLPFDGDGGREAYSHTVLNCGTDVYEEIEQLPQMPVPKHFSTFVGQRASGETGYGNTQETPYGEQLTWTLAGHLVMVLEKSKSPLSRCCVAYLKELPTETKVALYWH